MQALRSGTPGNIVALTGTVRDICEQGAACDSILLIAIHDPTSTVRDLAIQALRVFDDTLPNDSRDTIPNDSRVALLVQALQDPAPKVRSSAAGRLEAVPGDRAVVSALLKAANDPVPEVRAAVARGLDNKGDPSEVVSALAHMLASDSSGDVRFWAALVLSWMGPHARSAGASLVAALHDSDSHVRGEAANAIGAIGTNGTPAAVAQVAASLEARLADDSLFVRLAATEALGRLGELAVIGLEHAAANQDAATRTEAMYWLARRSATPEVISVLGKALKDSEEEVRREAAYALGGTDPGIAAAKKLQRSSDARMREGGLGALRYARYSRTGGVAGLCYQLTHGPWTPAPPTGDEDFVEFPTQVYFTSAYARLSFPKDSVRMDALSLQEPRRGRGPGPGRWYPLEGGDSLEIVWTGGMSGVYARLLVRGDSVSGFAQSFWDYSAPTQRATVTGRQIPCFGDQ
jgi:HEAT repeat protein